MAFSPSFLPTLYSHSIYFIRILSNLCTDFIYNIVGYHQSNDQDDNEEVFPVKLLSHNGPSMADLNRVELFTAMLRIEIS